MVREGAVVIDVGINRVEDATRRRGYRLVGDVDFEPGVGQGRSDYPGPRRGWPHDHRHAAGQHLDRRPAQLVSVLTA